MLCVVFSIIESHNFRAFCVVHVVRVVVVFIDEFFDRLLIELSCSDGPIFDFEGGCVLENVLQKYLLLWRNDVANLLIIDNYYLINSNTNDLNLLLVFFFW
jgi:hypothetical protein